ncbi:hypothetical protein PAECIP111893_01238 [Paenibacillus plantiphilus]|uniref:Uncharacterized protein n=1 Tax=Paenibacillus plantiphilus TaxID=2905650 RepID=A0ABN8G8D8_9BACL|nr:hypothetical protein PAECIP111893_01238 [Paenibacillus plantiphilus]
MENIYKSEVGKREVLGQYRQILASWPVENDQYEVETSLGPTFVIESGSNYQRQADQATKVVHMLYG